MVKYKNEIPTSRSIVILQWNAERAYKKKIALTKKISMWPALRIGTTGTTIGGTGVVVKICALIVRMSKQYGANASFWRVACGEPTPKYTGSLIVWESQELS